MPHQLSTFLWANTSTNSAALPVSESTFHVPTRKPQPSCSTSLLLRGSSLTQHPTLAQCCAAFWLGFPNSCLRRHVGAPCGDTQHCSLYSSSSEFCGAGENNRGDCSDNLAGCHRIRAISALASIIPHFCPRCPSWHNPSSLPWLGTGTKYAGVHTRRL